MNDTTAVAERRGRRGPGPSSPSEADENEEILAAHVPEVDEDDDVLEVVEIEPDRYGGQVPVITKAKVIYLGSKTTYSMTLKGRMRDEWRQVAKGGPVVRIKREAFPTGGNEIYDFRTVDSEGQLILERLRREDQSHAGKPWCRVEHGEHLRWFLTAKLGGERLFAVIIPRVFREIFDRYHVERTARESKRIKDLSAY